MGDPAGIGPEICLQLLRQRELGERCAPVIFGDAAVLLRCASEMGQQDDFPIVSADDALGIEFRGPAVVDLGSIAASRVVPGQCDRATGAAAYDYLEAALGAVLVGRADAIVTGPVHKEALHAAGFAFPGHTEYFATRTGAERNCMMLTSPEISCSLVTAHVGLYEVPDLLSPEAILDTIELTHEALLRIHGRLPRITVCGLNPHAGENGLFGRGEEQRSIVPAIEAARRQGIELTGPLPPDTAFLPARRGVTDGYICMYHDQGLIPLKALSFERAVNVTLGLPIVRTSVDHGTATDIAWQGKADATSLFQAVQLAAKLAQGADRELQTAS